MLLGSAVLTVPAVLAVPAGLALALVLPGLALRRALFPGRALSTVERLMLVPALSLAVLVLGGLALFALGLPLHRATWAGLTGGVTLVAWGAPAVVRLATGAAAPARRARVRPAGPAAPRTAGRLVVPAALLGAVAVLAGAAWLSVASARATDSAVPVLELSVVPALTAAGSSTVDLAAGTRSAIVAVGGNQHAAGWYLLRLSGPDGYTRGLGVDVVAGGTWSRELTVPAGERVTVALYRAGDTEPYRVVFLAPASRFGTG